MGKVDCTQECGFIKGVSGGCFVLINKKSAFTHNLGPTKEKAMLFTLTPTNGNFVICFQLLTIGLMTKNKWNWSRKKKFFKHF